MARLTHDGSRLRRGQADGLPPFERWARRAMRLYGENTYFLDNHIRPQAHFVRKETRLFAFERGLEAVTAWLEELCAVQGPPLEHKLPSQGEDVQVSAALRDKIEAFYAQDYELIAKRLS